MQNWVVEVIGNLGILGIALLMFLENVFPPLPSEVIMPVAGYLSTREQFQFWPAVLAGAVGSIAGAALWYAVGRRVSRDRFLHLVERHGMWLAMTPEDVDRASDWFKGHGRYSVLIGRLMPVIRTLISVPAGFSRMPFAGFLALTAGGSLIWTGALAFAGRFLGQRFQQVEQLIGPVTWIVIGIAVATYIYRVIRIARERSG